MVRLPALLLLLVAAAALPAWAQIQPRSLQAIEDPKGEFSISLRFAGKVDVSFRDIGTLATTRNVGDIESAVSRSYDDGYVLRDSRTTSTGVPFPDDGRTNSWRMAFEEQIVDEDGDGSPDAIAFHRYETRSDGAFINSESTDVPGIDVDYAYSFGNFGGRLRNQAPRVTWGGMVGLSLTQVNAKKRDSVLTTLITVEDRYTLDGAAPPEPPYTAPFFENVTTIDSNGNTITNSIDKTILLGNRPYVRHFHEEPGEANIEGFWQVRGGAFTGRAGLWARYRPHERLGLRASAGVTGSFLGLRMRYDEWLDDDRLVEGLRYRNQIQPEKWTYFGAYANLDAELWLTSTTSLFAGVSYEKLDKKFSIGLDGRTADIRFGSGTGLRFGITKLF